MLLVRQGPRAEPDPRRFARHLQAVRAQEARRVGTAAEAWGETMKKMRDVDELDRVGAQLLAALEGIAWSLEEDPNDPEWSAEVRAARAAIAAARGETPDGD